MRLLMKGGTWRNVEDEVLKAAVMKYGLNNWSRVASLLVRKSARQCRARWTEWLDPSVKKTEWSHDEDEKLLQLVKLFPTQWKTIAPLVGRTAHQCVERYEELLDLASGRTTMREDDPRKLRPGEVDPRPETKPARADAVDLDDDEREMLAEARARLANTRGKKAKRKARERQLEEARRIALLQKRRELKAAGISVSNVRQGKKRDMDYAKEVPFETQPPKGFYAVGDDERPEFDRERANRGLQATAAFRAKEKERRLRQADKRVLKRLHEHDMPEALRQTLAHNDIFAVQTCSHLSLPAPVVSDEQLTALAESIEEKKVQPEVPNLLSGVLYASTDAGSEFLLAQTEGTPLAAALSASTQSAQLLAGNMGGRHEAVMIEAKNAFIRQSGDTPLIGGINTELIDVQGEMNKRKQRRLKSSQSMLYTPTAMDSTPFTSSLLLTGGSSSMTPRDKPAKKARKEGRMNYLSILSSLPEVKNEFKIGDTEETETETLVSSSDEDEIEDAQDEADRKKRSLKELMNVMKSIHTRFQIFSEVLPRPFEPSAIQSRCDTYANVKNLEARGYLMRAEEMIQKETIRLFEDDNSNFLSNEDHTKLLETVAGLKAGTMIAESLLQKCMQTTKRDLSFLRRANLMINEAVVALRRGNPAGTCVQGDTTDSSSGCVRGDSSSGCVRGDSSSGCVRGDSSSGCVRGAEEMIIIKDDSSIWDEYTDDLSKLVENMNGGRRMVVFDREEKKHIIVDLRSNLSEKQCGKILAMLELHTMVTKSLANKAEIKKRKFEDKLDVITRGYLTKEIEYLDKYKRATERMNERNVIQDYIFPIQQIYADRSLLKTYISHKIETSS